MSKSCILVADDEADVVELVRSRLIAAGYDVLAAHDGSDALSLARQHAPVVAVLDYLMPGLTGLEVCRALKRDDRTARMSILLLSAKAAEIDRLVAFELGADDFVAKPFSPRELVLRIQAILRRKSGPNAPTPVLSCGEISVDLERYRTTVSGRPVELTTVEFKLLAHLLQQRGRIQTRESILDAVWGHDHQIEIRTIDTHLRRLREKLGIAGRQIHTVRGFGYRIDER